MKPKVDRRTLDSLRATAQSYSETDLLVVGRTAKQETPNHYFIIARTTDFFETTDFFRFEGKNYEPKFVHNSDSSLLGVVPQYSLSTGEITIAFSDNQGKDWKQYTITDSTHYSYRTTTITPKNEVFLTFSNNKGETKLYEYKDKQLSLKLTIDTLQFWQINRLNTGELAAVRDDHSYIYLSSDEGLSWGTYLHYVTSDYPELLVNGDTLLVKGGEYTDFSSDKGVTWGQRDTPHPESKFEQERLYNSSEEVHCSERLYQVGNYFYCLGGHEGLDASFSDNFGSCSFTTALGFWNLM